MVLYKDIILFFIFTRKKNNKQANQYNTEIGSILKGLSTTLAYHSYQYNIEICCIKQTLNSCF